MLETSGILESSTWSRQPHRLSQRRPNCIFVFHCSQHPSRREGEDGADAGNSEHRVGFTAHHFEREGDSEKVWLAYNSADYLSVIGTFFFSQNYQFDRISPNS
jgi:hypothetical protein